MPNPTVNRLTTSLSAPDIILTGTGFPNDYCFVTVYSGPDPAFGTAHFQGYVPVDGDGNWSLNLSAENNPNAPLIAGSYEVQVVSFDQLAGEAFNDTTSLELTILPAVPMPTFRLAADSGISDADGLTKDGTVLVGNLLPDATWEYQLNGGAWQAGSGASFALPGDGSYDIRVRQTDASGFTSSEATGTTDGALAMNGSSLLIAESPIRNSQDFTYVMTVTLDKNTGDFVLFGNGDPYTDNQSMIRVNNGNLSIHTANVGDEIIRPNFQLRTGVSYTFVATHDQLLINDGTTTHLIWNDATFDQTFGAYLFFGGWSESYRSTRPLDGTISDIQIYNSTLTGSSLQTVLEGGVVDMAEPGGLNLVAHYEFLEGAVYSDSSGYQRTLAYFGTPTLVSDGRSRSFVLDATAPTQPVISLVNDSGPSDFDGVTNDGRVKVTGLEQGATWAFSLDDGATWTAGVGDGFVLPNEGTYFLLVRQTDAAGNFSDSAPTFVDFDITSPDAPTLTLAPENGVANASGITGNPEIAVNLVADASWVYSLDGGTTWQQGVQTTLTLPEEGVYDIKVRQYDLAGNASGLGGMIVTYDSAPPAKPTLSLEVDTGAFANDGITSGGAVVLIDGLEATARWEFTLDGGQTWQDGEGDRILLPRGDATFSVAVRQFDAAGNVSTSETASYVIDSTAPGLLSLVHEGDGTPGPDARVLHILGLEAGASWDYSLDGGVTWLSGTGDRLTLPDGPETGWTIVLRQTDLAGNVGPTQTIWFDLPLLLIGTALGDELSGRGNDDFLIGLDGQDFLFGGGGKDILDGGDGDDLLIGGAGADVLVGGAGIDMASFVGSAAGVLVKLETGRGTGGDAEGDILVGIENLYGSERNDRLFGNAQANTIFGAGGSDQLTGLDGDDVLGGGGGWDSLFGGAGADRLDGGAGGDLLNGGQGVDTAVYENAGQGVVILMEEERFSGGDASGDRLIGIENVTGSGFADTLGGTAVGNVLSGLDGDDLLMGLNGDDTLLGGAGGDALQGGNGKDLLEGGAGADTLDGGAGADTASWAGSSAGVSVNLGTKTALGGDAAGDELIGIENLTGSDHADTLVGNVAANILNGGKDDDTLSGLGGNDRLYGDDGDDRLDGGRGNDILTGGTGADLFVFQRGCGDDRITDFGPGDTLSLESGLWAQTGAATLEAFLATQARQEGAQVVLSFSAFDMLRLDNMMLSDLQLHMDQYFV